MKPKHLWKPVPAHIKKESAEELLLVVPLQGVWIAYRPRWVDWPKGARQCCCAEGTLGARTPAPPAPAHSCTTQVAHQGVHLNELRLHHDIPIAAPMSLPNDTGLDGTDQQLKGWRGNKSLRQTTRHMADGIVPRAECSSSCSLTVHIVMDRRLRLICLGNSVSENRRLSFVTRSTTVNWDSDGGCNICRASPDCNLLSPVGTSYPCPSGVSTYFTHPAVSRRLMPKQPHHATCALPQLLRKVALLHKERAHLICTMHACIHKRPLAAQGMAAGSGVAKTLCSMLRQWVVYGSGSYTTLYFLQI